MVYSFQPAQVVKKIFLNTKNTRFVHAENYRQPVVYREEIQFTGTNLQFVHCTSVANHILLFQSKSSANQRTGQHQQCYMLASAIFQIFMVLLIRKIVLNLGTCKTKDKSTF